MVCLLIVESQVAEAAAVRDLSDSKKKSALFEGLAVVCCTCICLLRSVSKYIVIIR